MCSILFPVPLNFTSELICFVFFVCVYVFVCCRHLVKISCQLHLEIHLLRKIVTCSILILPAVCINELFSVHSVVNLFNPLMIQRKSSFNKKEEIIIPPFNRDEQIVTP